MLSKLGSHSLVSRSCGKRTPPLRGSRPANALKSKVLQPVKLPKKYSRYSELVKQTFQDASQKQKRYYSNEHVTGADWITGIEKALDYLIGGLIVMGLAFLPIFVREAINTDFTVYLEEKDEDAPKDETEYYQPQHLQEFVKGGESGAGVFRIVLTGGPCAGKSTAMAHISDRLSALGFRVYRVPEAATLIITGMGMFPTNIPDNERITFEGTMLKTKIALEDSFYALAKATGKPSVIICDRGTMDTAAYVDKETWDIILNEEGWNIVDLRDKRYDAVIHMVTTAIGAEKFYTTENNAARHESLDQARDLDFKVLMAWMGHPKIRIVDNTSDFKGKIQRVIEAVFHTLGLPKPLDSQRKFIVNDFDSNKIIAELKNRGIKAEVFDVEQTYLAPGKDGQKKGYKYLRRRGQNGNYTYTLSSTGKDSINLKNRIILERAISGREYMALTRQGDEQRLTVKKRVTCFLWNNVYYQLDTFVQPDIGLTILNSEFSTEDKESLQSILDIAEEVTGKKEFSSYFISKEYHNMPGPTYDWNLNPTMYRASQPPATEESPHV